MNRLKELRIGKTTQREVANLVGISLRFYKLNENGENNSKLRNQMDL